MNDYDISIIDGGFLTTVQDGGRFGYQRFGMPVSGPMDAYSHKLANRIVGNPANAAALECTLSGPTIRFETKTAFVVSGAEMAISLNQEEIFPNRIYTTNKGDVLNCGKMKRGSRTYIAFKGGLLTPLVLASSSTYLLGKIGGIEGRALKQGDSFCLGNNSAKPLKVNETMLYNDWLFDDAPIRLIPGPEIKQLTFEGLKLLLASEFTISKFSDRMGYQLDGSPLPLISSADIISSPVCTGTVQLPASGKPIILMADHQTTGGYARIAVVSSADIPRLAQKRPGDKVRFAEKKA